MVSRDFRVGHYSNQSPLIAIPLKARGFTERVAFIAEHLVHGSWIEASI
jgi:hypothetical protein